MGDTHNEGSSCRHRNPVIDVHIAPSDSQILSWDDATGSRCHCEQIIPAQRDGHQPSGAEVLRASLQTHKN